MKKLIAVLAVSNLLAWLPIDHPEEMNGAFTLGRTFVIIATFIALAISAINHITKTTRKCTHCGKVNDNSDTECTSCKQSLQ